MAKTTKKSTAAPAAKSASAKATLPAGWSVEESKTGIYLKKNGRYIQRNGNLFYLTDGDHVALNFPSRESALDQLEHISEKLR